MTRFVLCRAGGLELACERDPVVDAGSLPAVGDAVTILRRLQTLREAAVRSAADGRARAIEQGLQEARAAVRAQTDEAIGLLAARFEAALRAERERSREREVDLALAVVARIARGLGPASVIAALARTAIAELDASQPLRVRVPPGLQPVIREALRPASSDVAQAGDGHPGPIEVICDERLQGFDCEIDQDAAIVDAGLDSQLRALRDAFADRADGGVV